MMHMFERVRDQSAQPMAGPLTMVEHFDPDRI